HSFPTRRSSDLPIIQLHAKGCIGQQFRNRALKFHQVFFGHACVLLVGLNAKRRSAKRAASLSLYIVTPTTFCHNREATNISGQDSLKPDLLFLLWGPVSLPQSP